MDKKTLYGLLLMGLVIFGFMYLNKPSEEEMERRRAEAEKMKQQEQVQDTDRAASVAVDTISPAEIDNIRATILAMGKPETEGSSVLTLKCENSVLTLDTLNDSIAGQVKMGNVVVGIDQILSRNYGKLSDQTADNAVKTLKGDLLDVAKYSGLYDSRFGENEVVKLKNEVLDLEISTKGAQLTAARLLDKRYINFNPQEGIDSTEVNLLSPSYGGYAFTITDGNQRYETDEFYFTPAVVNDSCVEMRLNFGDGIYWGLRYTLPKGKSYTVKMDIVQQGMQNIIPPSDNVMDFKWTQRMPRTEAGRAFEQRNSALYYKLSGGSVENLSENAEDTEDVKEPLRWIAYKNQFFSTVLIAEGDFNTANLKSTVLPDTDKDYIKVMETETKINYSATSANPASFTFFLGPNSYPLLSDLEDQILPDQDLELTRLVPLGWTLFRWINVFIIIPVFSFLGDFIGSYGLIILLLTIFIKIILFPFTYKSYMSQAKMRVLSPEIKAINEKYPGKENAMKRQQETMALYNKAGASPFSGCLPMLLQLPILIAMFNFFPSAIELRGQSFLWAHDLAAPDAVIKWGFNLWLIGDHLSLFCLLMTITNVAYTYINMQSQPSGNSMPGMKWMMYLMPLMFLIFFNDYASGLSYYYFLSLLITIIQTFIFRRVVDEDKVRTQMASNAKKPKKKRSGFMARLEEAQRKQEQFLREQQKQKQKGRR